jgi:uncharacterized protein (TIGR03435 family)
LLLAATQSRQFEAASVKLHQGPGRVGITISGLRLNAEAEGVWNLIAYAYNLKSYQVSLTDAQQSTMGDQFYDISAKADGDAPPASDEFRQMLRSLLADRFQLRVHTGQRDVPVYELTVARNGPKFKPSTADAGAAPKFHANGRNWETSLTKASMDDVVRFLDGSAYLDRPVLDRTGLAGTYDIELTYTPDIPPNRREPDPSDISVFVALQDQLGLRLSPRKAPMEILIVDHVEKPSAN